MPYTGSAKCPNCGKYFNLDVYQHHIFICGKEVSKVEKIEVDFNKMSHKQAIEYYFNNPRLIESGMTAKQKEVTILRGRIDILGIDHNRRVCFIEIIHKSHYSKPYYERKLRSYRNHCLELIKLITSKSDDLKETIRMIMIEPMNKKECVTFLS